MAKKRDQVETGTDNVFADLGYPDAKERAVKVQLAVEVNRVLKERKLTQSRAADVLGIASCTCPTLFVIGLIDFRWSV